MQRGCLRIIRRIAKHPCIFFCASRWPRKVNLFVRFRGRVCVFVVTGRSRGCPMLQLLVSVFQRAAIPFPVDIIFLVVLCCIFFAVETTNRCCFMASSAHAWCPVSCPFDSPCKRTYPLVTSPEICDRSGALPGRMFVSSARTFCYPVPLCFAMAIRPAHPTCTYCDSDARRAPASAGRFLCGTRIHTGAHTHQSAQADVLLLAVAALHAS